MTIMAPEAMFDGVLEAEAQRSSLSAGLFFRVLHEEGGHHRGDVGDRVAGARHELHEHGQAVRHARHDERRLARGRPAAHAIDVSAWSDCCRILGGQMTF